MQDEARHVAFGRMALRDYYRQLTAPGSQMILWTQPCGSGMTTKAGMF